jgi:hypothetical protein
MPKKSKTPEPLVFHIEFQKGKAVRNRLPLAHVIATLQEIDLMVREVGKRIQRDHGIENPDGDFGIDLLAGSTGLAFAKGSVKAAAAATKDMDNAARALKHVIGMTAIVEKKQVASIDEYGAPVVRRLTRIGDIQEQDQTELKLRLAKEGKVTDTANFSETGIKALRSLSASDLAIQSVTIYGKLKKLADFSREDDKCIIWGELEDDSGEVWRLHFRETDLKRAQGLFTKQVVIHGDANYFKTKTPRLDVSRIDPDEERHYVRGFTRFRKNYKDTFGNRDPQEILKDIRG